MKWAEFPARTGHGQKLSTDISSTRSGAPVVHGEDLSDAVRRRDQDMQDDPIDPLADRRPLRRERGQRLLRGRDVAHGALESGEHGRQLPRRLPRRSWLPPCGCGRGVDGRGAVGTASRSPT